jgi:hypothetical protein
MSTRKLQRRVKHATWTFPKQLGLSAIGFLGVVGLVIVLTAAGQGPGTDTASITKLVTDALRTGQTLEVPAADYNGGPMSAAHQTLMHERADAAINLYYAPGPTHDYLLQALQRNISSDSTGQSRYLAGGLDWIKFTNVSIQGADATVQAQAKIWNLQAQAQGTALVSQTRPTSVIDYSATLHKNAIGWQIVNETVTIVSGDRP